MLIFYESNGTAKEKSSRFYTFVSAKKLSYSDQIVVVPPPNHGKEKFEVTVKEYIKSLPEL